MCQSFRDATVILDIMLAICLAGETAGVTAAGRITKRADGTEIHHGVQCDGCNQLPLLGPRFRSQVVADYDLCDKCLRGAQGSALAPFQRVMKDGVARARVALSFRMPCTFTDSSTLMSGSQARLRECPAKPPRRSISSWPTGFGSISQPAQMAVTMQNQPQQQSLGSQ